MGKGKLIISFRVSAAETEGGLNKGSVRVVMWKEGTLKDDSEKPDKLDT